MRLLRRFAPRNDIKRNFFRGFSYLWRCISIREGIPGWFWGRLCLTIVYDYHILILWPQTSYRDALDLSGTNTILKKTGRGIELRRQSARRYFSTGLWWSGMT